MEVLHTEGSEHPEQKRSKPNADLLVCCLVKGYIFHSTSNSCLSNHGARDCRFAGSSQKRKSIEAQTLRGGWLCADHR